MIVLISSHLFLLSPRQHSFIPTPLSSRSAPVRPTMSETTALGAAMAAGAAEGVSVWNLRSSHPPKVTCETYEPQINTDGEEEKQTCL